MRLVATLSLLAAVGAGAVALGRQDHPSSSAAGGSPVSPSAPAVVAGQRVHVDTGLAGTTFLPLGSAPVDGHTLSAPRAYNAMLQSPSFSALIPAGVRAYYGLLTHRLVSPVAHVRVWGFAVESRCTYSSGPSRSGDPPPTLPTRCRKWEFVDARTGHDIGVITQEVLPD